MAPECSFILSSGRKCRCAATRNQPVCRHHAPKSNVPASPFPKSERDTDLIRCRRLGRELSSMDRTEALIAVWNILDGLIDRGPNGGGYISDRTTGRYLRALLTGLREVPFPYPDFAPPSPVPPRAIPSQPPIDNESAAAFFAALATQGALPPGLLPKMPSPASRPPLNQTKPRVNQ
jgi:hypothetical protein